MPAQAVQSSAVIAVFHLVGLQLKSIVAIFAKVFQRVSGNRSNRQLSSRLRRSKSGHFIRIELESANAILILSVYDFDSDSDSSVIFLPNNRKHAARVAHQNNVEAVDCDRDTDVSEHGQVTMYRHRV